MPLYTSPAIGVNTFIMRLYLPTNLSTMMAVFNTVKPDIGQAVLILELWYEEK